MTAPAPTGRLGAVPTPTGRLAPGRPGPVEVGFVLGEGLLGEDPLGSRTVQPGPPPVGRLGAAPAPTGRIG